MARDDDSFWADIFRKFPVIATLMAIGGILGFGLGVQPSNADLLRGGFCLHRR